MFRVFIISLLLVSAGADAQIYKWVDAEGRTQFSDRPRPDAQQVGAKPKQTVPTKPVTGQDAASAKLGPYSAFEIASPEPNQELRQADDSLPVALLLVPALKEDHRIELVLDGTPVPVDRTTGTQFKLTGVPLGSHEGYARILDSQGTIIAATAAITFHLRKPIPPGVVP